MEDCNQALQLRPSYPKATLRRARAYIHLRCFAEAVDDFDTFQRESMLPSSFGSYRSNDSSGLDASARAAVRTEADLARASLQQQQQQQQRQQQEQRHRQEEEQEQPHRAQARYNTTSGRAYFRARSESNVFNRTNGNNSGSTNITDSHDKWSAPAAGTNAKSAPDGPPPPSPPPTQQQQHPGASSTRGTSNNKPPLRRASSAGDSSSAEWAQPTAAGANSSSSTGSSWSSVPRQTEPGSSAPYSSHKPQPQGNTRSNGSNSSTREPNNSASGSSSSSSDRGNKTRSPVQPVPNNASHYAVLGIETGASAAEVKKAYLKLALKFHPDKNSTAGAEERFKKVVEAKEVLTDPIARRSYDAELRSKTFMAASETQRSDGYGSSSSSSGYGGFGSFGRAGGVPASSRGSYGGFTSTGRYSSASYSTGYASYSGSGFSGYGSGRRNW